MTCFDHIVLLVILSMVKLPLVFMCPSECSCSSQRVQCYGLRLEDIPDGIPADTTHLDLQSNKIETINPYRIKHLSVLQELLLGYNQITKLSPGMFSDLLSLKILNLDSNLLTALTPGVFEGLGNLTSLYITNNKLVTVDGAFRNLSKVVRMDLGANRIQEITDTTFKDMKNLLYLMLPDNKLQKISQDSFTPLQSLSYLVLKDNPIKNGDRLFKKNHRLSYIDLTRCNLTNVPSGLPWATRYLQLRGNNITRVKKTAFLGTRYLNIIVLDENQITRIEKGAFSRARNLLELWLNDNLLKKIPSPFSSKVTKLHMSKNRLSKLSLKDFPVNSGLSTLSLNSNEITAINQGTFAQMKYLKKLYLNGNKLSSLKSDMFSGLSELESLSLNNNKLTQIQVGAFSGLSSLTKLDMAFIVDIKTDVEGNLFEETPSLKSLDLQLSSSIARQVLTSDNMLNSLGNITIINLMNNQLTTLNPNFQAYLSNAKIIKIAGNSWHCDKRLQWLSAWLKSHRKLFFMDRNIQCYTPPSLKGLPLSLLKPFQFASATTTLAPSTSTSTTITTTAVTTLKTSPSSETPEHQRKYTRKPKQPKPTSTQYPVTKIMLTKTKIVTITQRFFVYPSTTPIPTGKKYSKYTRRYRKHPPSTTQKTVTATTPVKEEKSPVTRKSPGTGITQGSQYTQQITSGMLTGKVSTPTTPPYTTSATTNQRTGRTTTVTYNPKFSNTTRDKDSLDMDRNDSKTGNSSDTDRESPHQATVTSSGNVNLTTVIVATSVSAVLLLIILGVVVFFAVRYRQNKLVYHRALQYRQDYSDVVFFVGEPTQDTLDLKQKIVRSRSDRGSTSSRPSEDITNELDTTMKVYTWDDE